MTWTTFGIGYGAIAVVVAVVGMWIEAWRYGRPPPSSSLYPASSPWPFFAMFWPMLFLIMALMCVGHLITESGYRAHDRREGK